MNLEEYLKQAKEQIKNAEIANYKKPSKKKEAYEEANDYYSIPNSKEGYAGEVIELSGEEFNVYYQKFGYGRTENQFRDKLDKMDEWFFDKPHRVQQYWIKYLPTWFKGEINERT